MVQNILIFPFSNITLTFNFFLESYERKYGRPADNKEKKQLARDMYEDYNRLSITIKIRQEDFVKLLSTIGMTEEEYRILIDSTNE
jgi:hypothetical protein